MLFIRNLFFITLIICLLIGFLIYRQGYAWVHPYVWYMVLFFLGVTGFTEYITSQGRKNDPANFQLYYLGSTVLRVLLSIGVIFIYVYFSATRELQFAANFFLLYFIYTGFEVYGILSNLRRNSKKQL